MNSSVQTVSNELLRNGLSAEALYKLANGCRVEAKTSSTVLLWLGLDAFFRGIATSLDDKPVNSAHVDGLMDRTRPLIQALSSSAVEQQVVERYLTELQDLI